MNTQNISDIVVAVATALIPVIFAWLGKYFKDNQKAVSLLEVLEPLAKEAVIAAEKLGLDKQLSGAVQKNEAIQKVLASLKKLGFDNADEQVIADAVEAEWAKLDQELKDLYKDKAIEQPREVKVEDNKISSK